MGTHKHYAHMTLPNPHRHVVPVAVLIQSKLVPITAVRPVTTTVPNPSVTRPRQAKTVVTKTNSPPRRKINRSASPKASTFLPKVTAVKAPMVDAAQTNSPPRRKINRSASPKASTFLPKVTAVKAPMVDAAQGNPQHALKDKGVIDSGCSRNMTGNMSSLSDFEELNGGYVAFGGNPKGGKISGKGKIRTGKLDFDDVYFVKELKFNLFSISKMCDKKHSVLFTKTKCLVLSPDFKLPNDNQVLLRVPRENNMYNVDLKHIVPSRDLTCIFAKATLDKSNLWHRRLGHINFKTMYKLVKGNLVRGLPSKVFENDNTCVACKKGKQHKATYSLLPNPFWAEAVNTACYVQNKLDFEGSKHESKVNVSPNSSAQSKMLDDKTKREAKVPAVGQLSPNNTNTFGATVKQKKDGIFISQDKYVANILRKFGLKDRKSTSTPIDTRKPLLKVNDGLGKSWSLLLIFGFFLDRQVLSR
nr:ribonuclease H-like domain-containing protein [Tanacetum cinerariifolium]